MLSHKYRFHGHGSLRYLFRNNQTARSRSLLLRYTQNKTRVHSRFAVVIAKKVIKSAAKRNRVRRRIYEVIRLHLDEIPANHDVSVTVFSAELLTMPSAEIEKELMDLFKRIKTQPVTTQSQSPSRGTLE